jgi:hypothetical protein
VDDLARQEDVAVGETPASLIRVVDGAIDAVTEAELACEVQRQPARLVTEIRGANAIDEAAVILGGELGGYRFLEIQAFPENELGQAVGVSG